MTCLQSVTTWRRSLGEQVSVPQHRLTPLKTAWLALYQPITENLKLDMRMNLKTRKVGLEHRRLWGGRTSRGSRAWHQALFAACRWRSRRRRRLLMQGISRRRQISCTPTCWVGCGAVRLMAA